MMDHASVSRRIRRYVERVEHLSRHEWELLHARWAQRARLRDMLGGLKCLPTTWRPARVVPKLLAAEGLRRIARAAEGAGASAQASEAAAAGLLAIAWGPEPPDDWFRAAYATVEAVIPFATLTERDGPHSERQAWQVAERASA